MTQQLGLPFQRHSHTSRMAALSMLPKEGTDSARVLDLLRLFSEGLTDQEGMTYLHMSGDTYRPRRIDLVNKYGLVMDSGQTRPTRSGLQAVVWKAI